MNTFEQFKHNYQRLPTNTNEYQRISTNTNDYQRISTNTNEYQRIPTNINDLTTDLIHQLIKQEPATSHYCELVLHHRPAGLDFATIETIATREPRSFSHEESLRDLLLPPGTVACQAQYFMYLRLQEPRISLLLLILLPHSIRRHQEPSFNISKATGTIVLDLLKVSRFNKASGTKY